MPFTKHFGTTAGAYSTETLWRKISIRTPAFAWTLSGSGTNEYYVRTAAAGNPGFQASPPTSNGVFINGSAATKGTLGALTAGQWGYGDNDTLGYSTVYVRLSDGTDPDTKTYDYVQFQQMPNATEHVRFSHDSGAISSATGLDQSAVAIGDFIVEEGYDDTIGSEALGYLIIDPDRFEFSGTGEAWINLHSAAIPLRIYDSYNPVEGASGLYLKGTALTVVDIMGGNVGVAVRPGEVTTMTTVRLEGSGQLLLGNGCTLTNLHVYSGEVIVRCAVTTTILYGGKITTEENGAMTTVTMKGGEYIFNSSGTITTFHAYGGILDCLQSGAARTISTLNKYGGSSVQIRRNKEAVTITTETPQDSYIETIGSL